MILKLRQPVNFGGVNQVLGIKEVIKIGSILGVNKWVLSLVVVVVIIGS